MRRLSIPLAPFFLAAYPVLVLTAANAEESIARSELAICLAVAILIASIGVLGAKKLTARRGVRAMLATLFVIFFLWYGTFVRAAYSIGSGDFLTLHTALLPVWFLLLSGLGLAVVRSGREFRAVSGYLDIFTGILLIFSLAQLAGRSPSPDPTELGLPLTAESAAWDSSRLRTPPDIYFFILDKYTGPTSLRDNYAFDLEPFIDSLSARGFYVPRSSRANYIHTHLSLASMLNWSHLDSIATAVGLDSRDRSTTYAMIEYNRSFRFLKRLGYEFVFYPSAYSASWRNRYADRQIPGPFRAKISLGAAVLAQTPLSVVVGWICRAQRCTAVYQRFPFTPETPQRLKEKLASLAEVARQPGPKFVLMHLLSPHEPYVFRRDCSTREALWPPADPPVDSLVKRAYTEQIECLNRLLLQGIDSVLGGSTAPPVIILQSDHGHGRMVLNAVTNEIIPLERLDDRRVAERTDIFAAYRFPYGGNTVLYDSITPVNVWPAMLNFYFGAGIPLREDATYWSDSHSPFRFRRIEPARPR